MQGQPLPGHDTEELIVNPERSSIANSSTNSSPPQYMATPVNNQSTEHLRPRPTGLPLGPNTTTPNYTEIFPARGRDAETGNRTTLRRQHTLTRPERQRSMRRAMLRSPSAGPPAARAGATTTRNTLPRRSGDPAKPQEYDDSDGSVIWTWFARLITCCFLPPCLRACGKKDRAVQQAWREKVALCMIILLLCAGVAFLTVGLRRVLCPDSTDEHTRMFTKDQRQFNPPPQDKVTIRGFEYSFPEVKRNLQSNGITLGDEWGGRDISRLFDTKGDGCNVYLPTTTNCNLPGVSPPGTCADFRIVRGLRRAQRFMDWDDLRVHSAPPHSLTIFNGVVLNLTEYLSAVPPSTNPLASTLSRNLGKDGTYELVRTSDAKQGAECLRRGYQIGFIGEETTGCISSMVIQTVSLIVILGVVLAKFFMALWFHWFGLARPKHSKMTVAADLTLSSRHAAPGFGSRGTGVLENNDLYTILLVTCYSEGEEGIRATLDSLANTDYPDDKKLLFIVADGMITGSGNERSTPDIIVGMMEQDPRLPAPEPKSYIAIANGIKQHNMARVHAGYYVSGERRVPMVAVVKCGTPAEATQAKPGNRGKRDSQLIIMNFLSRALFNDRMTALDYELFYRIQQIATTADKYEAILMVDADTNVAPDSLAHMANAMKNDVKIMGLCGETRIANKTASFTSAIQVFEYYISHHLGKAFESVFGGVTCLPGCFCMYRIKAPKGEFGATVPILTNPNVVEEYSENIVDTLHKKNLLLLGEDRFLTTLMLRNFPHRKMVFVPRAKCWTIVPDKFKVLLSQRRRWINSTVHNLLELVMVRDLCGTFCFSMQFVVLLELLGTVVLPAAICLTLYLIISAAVTGTAELVPFLMLGAILGLPGLLIAVTTRKFVYVLWMFVYLFSLPIWNFVLPAYAYWHFDDFSWGETRKVEGEVRETGHGNKEGDFESRAVAMKKWAEWEKERLLDQRNGPYDLNEKSTQGGQLPWILPAHNVPFGPPIAPGTQVNRQSQMPSASMPLPPMSANLAAPTGNETYPSLGPRQSMAGPPQQLGLPPARGPRHSMALPPLELGIPQVLGPRQSMGGPPQLLMGGMPRPPIAFPPNNFVAPPAAFPPVGPGYPIDHRASSYEMTSRGPSLDNQSNGGSSSGSSSNKGKRPVT